MSESKNRRFFLNGGSTQQIYLPKITNFDYATGDPDF
jgi:hypothetical protein